MVSNGQARGLPESQDRIVRRLAWGFDRRGLYPASLDREDYAQAGRLAILAARSDGIDIDDKVAYVAARNAMVTLDRRAFRQKRIAAKERLNPRRRRFVESRQELAHDVRQSLAALSPREKRIVVDVYWMGKSLPEIAAEIHCCKATVFAVLKRARGKVLGGLGVGYQDYRREKIRRYGKAIFTDRRRIRKADANPGARQRAWRERMKLEKRKDDEDA